MKDTVLEKKIAYTGEVIFPNKNRFPREFIAGSVLESVYLTNKRRNNNPTDSRYEDYSISHSIEKTALNTYFIDYLAASYEYHVTPIETWGNYLMPNERTQTRNNFQYKDLDFIPSCQMIYGALIENSIDVVLEISPYKKNIFKLKHNDYVIFNADINYHIGKNNSHKPAVLLTTLYAEANNIGQFL
jgi:hypothetical protein|tara:strand:- start:302 stop:862 length:561 start_codon:yes stop_codon:yes gene_type:complete